MKHIELYLDHKLLGCGYRRVFVVHEGRTKARLFHPITCRSVEVPLDMLTGAREIVPVDRREAGASYGYVPARALKRLREKLKERERLGALVSGEDAKEVLAALKEVA